MGDIKGIDRFINQVVYLDANIFIYAIEEPKNSSQYSSFIKELFTCIDNGQITAITSELTLSEVLVGAFKKFPELVKIYDELIINSHFLKVYSVDRKILKEASFIRSFTKIALADAIHVATAMTHQADIMLTNDIKMQVPNTLKKITLAELI